MQLIAHKIDAFVIINVQSPFVQRQPYIVTILHVWNSSGAAASVWAQTCSLYECYLKNDPYKRYANTLKHSCAKMMHVVTKQKQ